MKKILLWAVVAYFISKYIIEPSPVGGILASFLAPIGAMLGSILPGTQA